MAEITVPPAMVEAGYHAALNAPPCAHFEGDPEREGFATCLGCTTNAVLAAALSVCEVHEEWRVVGTDDAGEWTIRCIDATDARNIADVSRRRSPEEGAQVHCRLVITTPAEEADR